MSDEEKPKTLVYKRSDSQSTEVSKNQCGIKEICGACTYINEPYQKSLSEKWQKSIDFGRASGILEYAHIEQPRPALKQLAYRNHAKLSVRSKQTAFHSSDNRRFAMGIYRPGTHDLVDVSSCPLHKETINAAIDSFKDELENSSLSPYNEETGEGDLRYVAIRSSHLTAEIMMTFVVTNEAVVIELKSIATKLRDAGHQVQSAYVNFNSKNTNVIFGDQSRHLIGVDRLREGLVDLSFEIGPTSFFQVNPWEAERIYRRIEQLSGTHGGSQVAWDLFCGVGQIAMMLSRAGYRTLGIEMNGQAIRDAQKNSARNLESNHPTFIVGKVEEQIELIPAWAKKPKLIVTNPARKGLAPETRAFLKNMLAENPDCQLIYISCEFETFVRDVSDITSQKFRLRQLEAFDMFPYTDKMEWLGVIR